MSNGVFYNLTIQPQSSHEARNAEELAARLDLRGPKITAEGWYKRNEDYILVCHIKEGVWVGFVWYGKDPREELRRAATLPFHG